METCVDCSPNFESSHNLVWFFRGEEKSRYLEKVTGLLYFCGKTLGRHCKQRLSIKKFSLIHCLGNCKSFSLVDHWVNYVVRSDVKKLSLIFIPGYCIYDQYYCKVVIYNIVFCWLIFWAKFDCNVIQSFVPCIYCGISL